MMRCIPRPRDHRGRFINEWRFTREDGTTRTIVHIDPARADETDPPHADMLRALYLARAVRYVAALVVVLIVVVALRAL